tara:strand:+ start:716 stop:922 length:207 start_codon:yes stop_codon:yes gene_type:complete
MKFEEEVYLYKYLVMSPNGYCNVFQSLRLISQEIYVDYTTISKKLKEKDDGCFCISKKDKETYFIKKI